MPPQKKNTHTHSGTVCGELWAMAPHAMEALHSTTSEDAQMNVSPNNKHFLESGSSYAQSVHSRGSKIIFHHSYGTSDTYS